MRRLFLIAGVTATLSSTLLLYMLIAMFRVHPDIVALENKPDMSVLLVEAVLRLVLLLLSSGKLLSCCSVVYGAVVEFQSLEHNYYCNFFFNKLF